MRLFVAIDLNDEIRRQIRAYVDEVRHLAPQVRWVTPDSLHVTLKFIGERSETMVGTIESALKTAKPPTFDLSFRGCGFFPTAKAARVFWVGLEAGDHLSRLAADVEETLSQVGIPKEKRNFSPHLTLARASGSSGAPRKLKGDRPNHQFTALQKHLETSALPQFESMTVREFFLYQSQLSSKGSTYTKLARFGLAGTV